jgi:hypothetical protein
MLCSVEILSPAPKFTFLSFAFFGASVKDTIKIIICMARFLLRRKVAIALNFLSWFH